MRKNQLIVVFILVMLAAGVFYLNRNSSQIVENDYFNRNVSHLQYSRHARCRMDCRHVSEAEVMDILKNGRMNQQKTRPDDRPCPSFALEGYSIQDHQHLRIVFAQCDDITRVVTCIDLDHDFECDCK
ncbi:DUF4258 domain-containing protein [Flavihumibacter profundi]|uniref:DUF4258 domain-containing protein n=1 Tax=Flavihumibacter profundi TaxID=2716883 RepID=UPI001CC3A513|nr:DUF4258 domain-containing protein [Flavihumibacter profundi]MBZ5856346.1 DUF4258 domain-containing protein [Flavihumibacter profundi]